MELEYIPVMIQSLEKKTKILDRIIWLNEQQKDILQDEIGDPDRFDKLVEEKSSCIDELELLDSGFEKVFERVRETLNADREGHAEAIRTMQGLIKGITDRSVKIQAQEARNKDLMMKKFAAIKVKARTVRVNERASAQYYQNMMNMGGLDPQFVNKKK